MVRQPLMPIAIDRSKRVSTHSGSGSALSLGSQGPLVSTLQSLLMQAGFMSPQNIDGDFGPKTAAAIRRFQASQRLVPDGVAGTMTWAALSAATTGSTYPADVVGQVLRVGTSGALVRSLQNRLSRAGFDLAVDGRFGPATQQVVMSFQRGAQLKDDGVVGPSTWRALSEAAMAKPAAGRNDAAFRDRILEGARRELGTVERTNSNDGAVTKYPAAFGRGPEKYCADFVSYVITRAGGTMNDASCQNMIKKLKAQGQWKGLDNPKPGDLVLFDLNDDQVADHVGFVEKVSSDGSLYTIEGNTDNPSTGKEGVWRRVRPMSGVLGFGVPF